MKKNRKKQYEYLLKNGNQTKEDVLASRFDPNGSYTGKPIYDADGKIPVQDADDL